MGCEVWEAMCNLAWRQFHTSSYISLCQPGEVGWKALWHILFLMCSQAQMVSGKTIQAKLSVRMFVSLLFPHLFSHCIFASFCMFLSLSHSCLFLHFSCSHTGLSGTQAPFKNDVNASVEPVRVCLRSKPSAGAPYWGQHTQNVFPFWPVVPLHGHTSKNTSWTAFQKGNIQYK